MDFSCFKQNGYQIVRGVFDEEAVHTVQSFLKHEMEWFLSAEFQLETFDVETVSNRFSSVVEKSGWDGLDGKTQHLLQGHYPLSTRLDETLRCFPKTPKLQEILKDLLQSEQLNMHLPPMARAIYPNNPYAGVPAHQDISYSKHMGEFITVWTPLVEINDLCGGVSVMKGSADLDEQLTDYDHEVWLKPVEHDADAEWVDCLPMSPGDVLLLNRWNIHKSMSNSSDYPRVSMDMRFFGEGGYSSKHYLDMKSWEVIAPKA